ncbi:hypothetical protein Dsin_031808 [Dipteronia sinensis]|uniref:DUF4283 domain-containing protein n=1 Tax=Dipteronia sinensis TaxID=43782 RepID=A0AAD9ZMD7_9ROSI|nr:hypothetical protein Dsin_031808 [Dipteronia sinensis]
MWRVDYFLSARVPSFLVRGCDCGYGRAASGRSCHRRVGGRGTDGVSLLAGSGSGAAGVSAGGGGKSFAQALQRPIPSSKYRIPLRRPELINGDLGFVFSDAEMERAAEDLKYALVLKFLSSRPSIDVLRVQIIKTWGFSDVPMISFMDDLHVLLHLANEKDYIHAWAREGRVGHTDVVCRVGEKPIRKEGLRKEREEKVWKEVGRKDSQINGEKGNYLTVVEVQDQGDIENIKENVDESLRVEKLQKADIVEEGEFVQNINKYIVSVQVVNGGCSGSKNNNEIIEEENVGGGVVIVEEIEDFEEEVEGVVCRNSFAVLSDGDNELGIDSHKDNSSDPGDKSVCNSEGKKNKEVQLEVVGSSNQCLTVLMSEDSGSLLTTFVFAKCSQIERRELWEQLHGISTFNVAWVVLGDFNTIRSDTERVGGRPRISSAMAEFNECINICELLDLRFEGRQLSWCNGHQGLARSWAKLDRVLINNEFVAKYGDAKACLLNRNTSDHAPILLQFVADMERYGSAPFIFQNMWTSHVGFLDVLGNSWNEPMVSESGLHWLVDEIIRELEERVEHYEELLQGEYSEDIEEEFLVSKPELDVWHKREEMRLAQQAKIKWLSEGD